VNVSISTVKKTSELHITNIALLSHKSVKFGWGTNWESFGTEKPYGPSVQRMIDGGWIPVGRQSN